MADAELEAKIKWGKESLAIILDAPDPPPQPRDTPTVIFDKNPQTRYLMVSCCLMALPMRWNKINVGVINDEKHRKNWQIKTVHKTESMKKHGTQCSNEEENEGC